MNSVVFVVDDGDDDPVAAAVPQINNYTNKHLVSLIRS